MVSIGRVSGLVSLSSQSPPIFTPTVQMSVCPSVFVTECELIVKRCCEPFLLFCPNHYLYIRCIETSITTRNTLINLVFFSNHQRQRMRTFLCKKQCTLNYGFNTLTILKLFFYHILTLMFHPHFRQ